MTADVQIRVERITREFGKVQALSEVSFSVRRGEILGLIGPDGSTPARHSNKVVLGAALLAFRTWRHRCEACSCCEFRRPSPLTDD